MKIFITGALAIFLVGMGFFIFSNNAGTAEKDIQPVKPVEIKTAAAAAENNAAAKQIQVRLKFAAGEAIVELQPNPTSRDFIAQLPLTLSFRDFNNTEKIANPPRRLVTEQSPYGLKPTAGDLALYVPWGNLAIFYRDFRYSDDLIPMGKVISGLDLLRSMEGDFSVQLEVIDR